MMQRKHNGYVYLINIHVCDICTLLYFFNYIIVSKILYVTTFLTYRLLETIDCIYYLLLKFTWKTVSLSFQCFVSLLVFSSTLMLSNTVITLPIPNFPLRCEFEPRSWRDVLDTALCDTVCQ